MKRIAVVLAVVLAIGLASAGEFAAQSPPASSPPSSTAAPAEPSGARELTLRLDVPNFCCPEYIAALRKSVAESWQAPPDIAATTIVRFIIERDGQISRAMIELPSGVADADERALRAVRLAKPAALPAAFNQPALTVHLTFASAQPPPSPSIQFDSQGVDFGPWIRRFIPHMRRNWFIPAAARTQRGRTVVTFSVAKDGVIDNVKVVQPSGIEPFDQAAFRAVLNANPLEPLPPAYPKDEIQFTITFFYNEQPPAK